MNVMSEMVVVVTGPDTYRYIKLEDNMRSLNQVHGSLETGGQVESTDYTCHCWAKDTVQLVIATGNGDILVASMNGQFKIRVPRAPVGYRIDSMIAYARGIIFAGEQGLIWPYETTSNESQVYRPQ